MKIDAKVQSISKLKDYFFLVPDYQREYVWKPDDEVEQFLIDIENEYSPDAKEQRNYFLGSIIIVNKLADLLDEYVFPLAFDGMPADDVEIILNPSGKFVQGGPDADTGLTGRKLMVDSYGTFAPHGGGAFSGKDATKVDRSGAYMARYIAKNIVAAGFAQRCQVTLAYTIGEKEPVMVDVNTFGTGGPCEDDCLSAAVRKAYDLTPAGIIKQLNLLNPMYSRTAAGGHFGREDFPWENIERMSDLAAYIV